MHYNIDEYIELGYNSLKVSGTVYAARCESKASQ